MLGSHELDAADTADILIERHPAGWCIFVHPKGCGDPSGYLFILDDGRSFAQTDAGPTITPYLRMLRTQDELPELDGLPGETVS